MDMTIEELLLSEDGIKAIDEENFIKAYDLLEEFERPKLTKLFYSENIDPLNYMCLIPKRYMDKSFNKRLIRIPENIVLISQEAFIGCDSICQIDFSERITRIGMLAFSDCTNLKELTFPRSLEVLDQWAFTGCKNLREIHFEKDYLRYISNYVFGECSQLEIITYTGTIDEWRKIDIAGDAFKGARTKNVRCADGIFSIYEDED